MSPIQTPNTEPIDATPATPAEYRPLNGYKRAIATALAAVTLTLLLYAAVLVLTANLALSRDRAIVLAVALGLHTFALTILTGDSPWPHILHLVRFRGMRTDED